MYQDCSIMILSEDNKIYKLETDANTQNELCALFSESTAELRNDKIPVEFDGNYKPNEDEYFRIRNFQLSDEIKDAIRNPLGVESFAKIHGEYPEIKAVFLGNRTEEAENEVFTVSFQRLRKEQIISRNKLNLFLEQNTFQKSNRFGFGISEIVDCCFIDGDLIFTSYFYARQVLDLRDYYRSATDGEVVNFTQSQSLDISNPEQFVLQANSWVRRKIASINDSKILDKYSVAEIKNVAENIDIEIQVKKGKIIVPDDKNKVKIILGFLDEEAYKGPFSNISFLAGSKRKI